MMKESIHSPEDLVEKVKIIHRGQRQGISVDFCGSRNSTNKPYLNSRQGMRSGEGTDVAMCKEELVIIISIQRRIKPRKFKKY